MTRPCSVGEMGMTEDNRRPGDEDAVPGQEPERQDAAAPPETVTDQEIPAEPPAADPERDGEPVGSDRLVAGGRGEQAGGFAPPDAPRADAPPQDDVPGAMAPREVPLQD